MDNLNIWSGDSITSMYRGSSTVFKGEMDHINACMDLIKNGRILDIGVGAGRTTAVIQPVAKEYIGIDYSETFVAITKEDHPAADIRHGDARDLSAFEDNSFDVVLFSFNGIDYIDLEGRLKVIREVNRVLKPKGKFIFSTHNREVDSFNKFTSTLRHETGFTKFKSFIKYLRFLPKHLKMRQSQVVKDDYAIINDSEHGFSLMTFYITLDTQKKQLDEAGFDLIEVVDERGEKDVANFNDCDFLQYLAEKR